MCVFKLHSDHINTILEVEDTILSHLGPDKYADMMQSSLSVTTSWGQVFKCSSTVINSTVGCTHDIILKINKIKVFPSHVKLCWKCVKFSEPKQGNCLIEMFEEEEDPVIEEPEPDPDILDTIKRELLTRIEKTRESYMSRCDMLVSKVFSIDNVSAFEAIEECLIAL